MLNKDVAASMPYYRCHKEVRAVKIERIDAFNEGATITPVGYGRPFDVDGDFMVRHKLQAGGYIVVYEDGYTSYSPAKAFEEGYTRI